MGKKGKRNRTEQGQGESEAPVFDSKGDPEAMAHFRRQLQKINPEPLRESSSEGEDGFDLPKIRQGPLGPKPVKRSQGKTGKSRRTDDDEGESGGMSWKALFFFFLMFMPVLIEMVDMGGGALRGLRQLGVALSDPQKLATVVGFVVTQIFLYYVLPRRWFVRLVVLSVCLSLTLPTINVYTCSPARLNNSYIGTNFSLRAKSNEILKTSLSSCLSSRPLSSYAMSLYRPRLVVLVQRSGVEEVNITSSESSGDHAFRLLLLRSARSVQGQIYYLHMMVKVARRVAKRGTLNDLLARKLNALDVYRFIGRLIDTPANMQPMQANLQRQSLYIRPVLFEVHDIELIG